MSVKDEQVKYIIATYPASCEDNTEFCLLKNYGKKYYISNTGLVWSTKYKKFLKPWICNWGYRVVKLTNLKGKIKNEMIARLVANTFIKKQIRKTKINHKDGNKQNDIVSNLEWCTQSYNVIHSFDNKLQKIRKIAKKQSKYRGIYWLKITNEWRTRICKNRKYYEIGRFSSEEDAHNAYLKFIEDNKFLKENI